MAKSISGDKIVATKTETGSLFPTNREETYKDIIVDGRKESFYIGGGVFSANLQILGEGTIRGPVFASKNLRMENNNQNPQCYLSGLEAYQSILSQSTGSVDIFKSLSGDINGLDFLIRGDVVSSEKVILSNTCVIGSIEAPDVILNNSIVFGTIQARSNLEVICSIIATYNVKNIKFVGPCSVLVAGGISEIKPEMCDFKYGESILKSSLRYIPICRIKKVGCGMDPMKIDDLTDEIQIKLKKLGIGLFCSTWLKNECPYTNNINLSECDFIQKKVKKINNMYSLLENQDITNSNKEKTKTIDAYFFGIQGRALDLKILQEQNKDFFRILHGIFAFEHLTPENKAKEKQLWKKLTSHEKKLFEIATKGLESRY
ncbi:MAG: hypothetical protein JW870_11120 [Candidatus Delongbacteria bacterium]|nr:hypothetical protein [Candidatus Delongbacteria bacterium]